MYEHIKKYNTIITDSKEIANGFNSYCSNIGNDLSASIPNVEKSFSDNLVFPQPSSRYSLSLNLKLLLLLL
jgi:hypothetical protein